MVQEEGCQGAEVVPQIIFPSRVGKGTVVTKRLR